MTLATQFGTDVLLIGWGHSRFGKLDEDVEDLVVSVANEAITSANVEPGEIDAIFVGQFNPGLTPLVFTSSLALQLSPDLFGVPATGVENVCASGSAALHQGVNALLAATARTVLLADGTVYPDGRLAVNVSGGLEANGHPVGATGVKPARGRRAAADGHRRRYATAVAATRRGSQHGRPAVANSASVLETI